MSLLSDLAGFGSAVGATVASTYRAVNTPTVTAPLTQIPQSSTVTAQGFFESTTGQIVVLLGVGLAVVLAFRAIGKR